MRNRFPQMDRHQDLDSSDIFAVDTGDLERLDREIRRRYAQWYQEVLRNQRLGGKTLKKGIHCKVFKARLRSQVCMLRKKNALLEARSGVPIMPPVMSTSIVGMGFSREGAQTSHQPSTLDQRSAFMEG